jgi:dihydrofolate reductase
VHISIDDADTFFPPVDESEWSEVRRESFERGEKFECPFEFVVLERREK